MTDSKRLLVVVDPTASFHPAIERAAWLAHHTQARVELFISDYSANLADGRSANAAGSRTAVLERHRKRLELLAEPLRKAGIMVEIDARWDYPLHDSIVRKAIDGAADVVIKDTHYHSALQRSIFSNTDWSLIRACAATLWLVKPRPPGQRPCLIAAVDPLHERDKPADLDNKILATATQLAVALGGEVHAFHAFDVSAAIAVATDSMTMPIALPIEDFTEAIRAEHGDAVAELCAAHGIASERTHVHQGVTRDLLMTLTEQLRADAVIMGAISRSGLKGLFLGNTAEDVLDRLHCDLIIVKPEAFKAALP
ncbi:MAG TPA: universal stress protein [Gammaproteobacteria bacterium]|nr:universal stress protein [Gammaproteobacteria bacterium]